jgi:chemotaxis signal transduction protein
MKAPAWIMPITDNLSVAVGQFELVHILPDKPTLFTVPKTPSYCQQVLVWQNKIIPVMSLATRFGEQKDSTIAEHSIIAIFAYRSEITNLIEYGALFVNNTPRRVEVGNEQASPLPPDLVAWTQYISCCFQETDTEQVIPILKLECLFAAQTS